MPRNSHCDYTSIDELVERSFVAPKDSIPIYCGQAESLLLSMESVHQDEAPWLSRLALINGRLAEFEGKSEKIARVRLMDELCRAALVADSTNAMAHVLLGVLNFRLCKMSCIERLLARTFIGRLPKASLEDSEAHLRRAVKLEDCSVYNHYALARTLEEQEKLREAAEFMRLATLFEPVTILDLEYKKKAAASLEDLEDRLFDAEHSWCDDLDDF